MEGNGQKHKQRYYRGSPIDWVREGTYYYNPIYKRWRYCATQDDVTGATRLGRVIDGDVDESDTYFEEEGD